MKLRIKSVVLPGMILLGLLLAGCASYSLAHYVSPRISGQVVDSQTREPIKDVQVERVLPPQFDERSSTTKGAAKMENQRGVNSKADGAFQLDSKRDIAVIADIGWLSVTIKFTHDEYQTFMTNYYSTNAVIQASGEPVINAGTISLTRKPK